jgi:hypothetical protein
MCGRCGHLPPRIASDILQYEYAKCYYLCFSSRRSDQITVILQVIYNLFPAKWCFFAKYFVLLRARNRTTVLFGGTFGDNCGFFENKFLGH